MTFFKSLFGKRFFRLCLFSIPLQTALFAQLSFYPESDDDNSLDEYYDPEPMDEMVSPFECDEDDSIEYEYRNFVYDSANEYIVDDVPFECISVDENTYCYPDDLKYFETSHLKYYDPTTQNFSTDNHIYQPEIDREALPYYDHRYEEEKRKYYPPVKLEDIPYYEPSERAASPPSTSPPSAPSSPMVPGSVVNEGELHLPPEAATGEISKGSPSPSMAPGSVVNQGELHLPPEAAPGKISKGSPSPNIEKERDIQHDHALQKPQEQPASSHQQVPPPNDEKSSLQPQERPKPEEKPMPVGSLQSAGKAPRPVEVGQISSPQSLRHSYSHNDSALDDNTLENDSSIAQGPQPSPGQLRPGQRPMQMITPSSPIPSNSPFNNMLRDGAQKPDRRTVKDISLSFNNVPIIEYIRYISKIAGRNFVFNEEDLQFNITVVTEQMESIETLMTSLLQELKVRDLSILEQANNIIIHRNPRVRAPARIVSAGTERISGAESEIVTRIFHLRTLDPQKAVEIIRPLLTDAAAVEVLKDSNKLIITDLVVNANRVAQMIGTLDAPNSGVQIGQYVVRNAHVDSLVDLAGKILQPIAQGNPFILVPNAPSKTIYVVSNQYLVQKTLAILDNLDTHEGKTNVLSLEKLAPVSTQGAFEKRQARRMVGVVPPGEVESGGAVPAVEGEEAVRVGRPRIYTGPPLPPGVPPIPEGFEGTPEEWIYTQRYLTPEGLPLRPLTSEGRLMNAMGEMEGEGGGNYPVGMPYAPYGVATGPGVLTSQGYVRGAPTQAFPYGGIQSYGAPGMLEEGRDFLPGGISTRGRFIPGLPLGYTLPVYFHVKKLRYLEGAEVEIQLREMANNLILSQEASPELIKAVNSALWDTGNNSLILVGTARAIRRIDEFINRIDKPIRQVFIEMLILETDVADSLTLGVDWATNFGGGPTNGNQASQLQIDGINPLAQAISNINLGTTPPTLPSFSPANLPFPGYAASIIGTHLTHHGTRFNTIAALIQAVHFNQKINIVLNPKIIAQDAVTAEVFVGSVDRYKSQSITNSNNGLVTNNFQFIDVGTRLLVTPRIGNNNVITLEIVEERSTPNQNANVPNTNTQNDFNLIPVINKDRTVTEVHIPDGFFAVVSGLQSTQELRSYNQIPCLGGIPIIGGACKTKNNTDNKLNVMIFVRPKIIDTPEDVEELTKRQQDIWCEKQKLHRPWNFEIDETLDLFNLKPTDPDEIGCGGCNQ